MAVFAMNCLVSILNISVNSTLIYLVFKLRLWGKPTFVFVVFMSISDVIIGLGPQSLVGYLILVPGSGCRKIEILAQSLLHSLCEFSGLMINLITIDRYLHIRFLNNYNRYMNRHKALVMVVVSVVICLLLAALSTVASITNKLFQLQVVLMTINTCMLIAVCALYVICYYRIRNRTRALQNLTTQGIRRNDLHLAIGILLIFVTLLICYLPNFVTMTIWLYQKYYIAGKQKSVTTAILSYSFILVVLNSSLNALILMYTDRRIRTFLKSKICRNCSTVHPGVHQYETRTPVIMISYR